MESTRRWPSRRACTAIFLVLALGAAIQAFVPPIDRQARAQRLYEDAWFGDLNPGPFGPPAEYSVPKLEAALRLSPDNSLYQQALVWKYPIDRLPQLIKGRKLGSEALRLAYGLLYMPSSRPISYDKKRKLSMEVLSQASELKRLDGGNSIACYHEADCLIKAGRLEDAYADVRVGNRLGEGRRYVPDTSESVSSSMSSPEVIWPDFYFSSDCVDVARTLANYANLKLQTGDVGGACEIMEECCRMGVNFAESKPHNEMSYLAAKSIFDSSVGPLSAIRKDFGMKKELAPYTRIRETLQIGRRAIMRCIQSDDPMGEYSLALLVGNAIPGAVVGGLSFAMFLMAAASFGWLVSEVVRRRRREQPITLSPWGEGRLARLFLAVYLPIFAISVLCTALARFCPGVGRLSIVTSGTAAFVPFGLVVLGQIVVLAVLARILRRVYIESTGEKVGILGFMLRPSAARGAWKAKWTMIAVCGQFAFLLGMAFLIIIVYRPIFGVQPWQMNRTSYSIVDKEIAMDSRLVSDLAKAAPAEWHVSR